MTKKGIPFIATHDGRTIRYHDPLVKKNDTVKVDIKTGKIIDIIKFEIGNTALCTTGHNVGRVGTFIARDPHPGSFDIVHLRDATGAQFATRLANIMVIGKGENNSLVSLPKGRGIKKSIMEQREKLLKHKN